MKNRNQLKRSVYFYPHQLQQIEEKAGECGLRRNAFLVSSALRVKLVPKPECARFFGELGRIGNNINQIAYRLNSGGIPGDMKSLSELRQLLIELRGALL